MRYDSATPSYRAVRAHPREPERADRARRASRTGRLPPHLAGRQAGVPGAKGCAASASSCGRKRSVAEPRRARSANSGCATSRSSRSPASWGRAGFAAAAHAGPGSVTLWLLAAVLVHGAAGDRGGVAVGRSIPAAGGLYLWTRNDFGRGTASSASGVYWMGIAFWFPSAAMFYMSAGVCTGTVAPAGRAARCVLAVALAAIWIALGTNLVGMKIGKWTENIGGASPPGCSGALLVLLARAGLERGAGRPRRFTSRPPGTGTRSTSGRPSRMR